MRSRHEDEAGHDRGSAQRRVVPDRLNEDRGRGDSESADEQEGVHFSSVVGLQTFGENGELVIAPGAAREILRRCRHVELLNQAATRVVGAERADGKFGNFYLRRAVLWRASSDEEELEIESERRGGIVNACLQTAAVGQLDLDPTYIRSDDALDPKVVVR